MTAQRLARLRDDLAATGDLDALIVSDLTNIRWLTGFTGSNGWLVATSDRAVLVTDGRYGEQAQRQLAASGVGVEVVVGRSATQLQQAIVDAVSAAGSVGFEGDHTTFSHWRVWQDQIGNDRLRATTGLVEAGRRSKDADEIAMMAEACRIADAALAQVAPRLGDGLTEAQVRNQLESAMRDLGAAGPSYETIVASGPANAPMPHHRPTTTLIEPGHTVIIDVGALVGGYHSDMTRTFIVGEPTALQQEVYDIVLAAQTAGVAAVRPGLAVAELDAVCRGIITDAGFGQWFSHGTGHGVGLLIHEHPFVNAQGGPPSNAVLQVGDVVTVEPGVYRGDFGGVRIEDLVVVTSDGCRVLTNSPKDSPCLPLPPTT